MVKCSLWRFWVLFCIPVAMGDYLDILLMVEPCAAIAEVSSVSITIFLIFFFKVIFGIYFKALSIYHLLFTIYHLPFTITPE